MLFDCFSVNLPQKTYKEKTTRLTRWAKLMDMRRKFRKLVLKWVDFFKIFDREGALGPDHNNSRYMSIENLRLDKVWMNFS